MASHKFDEGTWFEVPLQGGAHAVGLVARKDAYGGLFAYFFFPSSPPTLQDLAAFKPSEAVGRYLVGDGALTSGRWRLLGQADGWEPARWPLPAFRAADLMRPGAWTVRTYDPADLRAPHSIVAASAADVESLPDDGVGGPQSVEIKLQTLVELRARPRSGSPTRPATPPKRRAA